MKIRLPLIVAFFLIQSIGAQTTLSAGDIAILQYNADGSPEIIKFLALRSMESGTTINFTDNGWRSDNTFRTGEGTDTWTASSNISCGDIITFTLTNISLATNGDQILAYQGLTASPTFIFAFNSQGSAVWQTTANNASSSALPTGLTNGVNAIAITEIDNAMYDSSTLSGTRSAILTAICTNANWGGSNTVTQDFTDTFTSEINWNTSWSGTGNPDEYFRAILHEDYDTTTDGDFTACECQVNSTRTLTINSGGTVTVQNGITNNGSIVVESGGSFVQETPDSTNTGTDYIVNRNTTTMQEASDFTYWSSPLSSSTMGQIANDASQYFNFDSSTQVWVRGSTSTTMSPGVGYAVTGNKGGTYPGVTTAAFSGSVFNNGDINVTLGFSDDADDTNDANFLGNPYPSAIDGTSFLNDNSAVIGSTLHFWTHNTADSSGDNTADDYASYTTMGGTAAISGGAIPDGNIASGQGFFAQAIATGSASFTNSMRISGNNTTFFRASKTEKDRIWLNLTSNDSFSQILIGFTEDSVEGIDRNDGFRFSSGANSTFYSIVEGKQLAIQGKPSLTSYEVIPLGYNIIKANQYSISIEKIEGKLSGSLIQLKDNLLNVVHNLKTSDYVFQADEINSFDDRFELIISSETLSNPDDVTTLENALRVYRENNFLTFELTQGENTIKSINLYNILGSTIGHISNTSTNNTSINMNVSHIRPTILIAKIVFGDGQVLHKKLLLSK